MPDSGLPRRPRHSPLTPDRLNGVLSAVRDAGLGDAAVTDIPGDATGESVLTAGERLLAAGPLPDGIICHSDSVAFGFYRALRKHGVPTDSVRLIGYDDIRGQLCSNQR